MPPTRVAIVGTAGRTPQLRSQMDASTMLAMRQHVMAQLDAWNLDPKEVILVSGGSAWSDHVTVRLFVDGFLTWAGCELHLPCNFDRERCCYFENGPKSCGAILNMYHRLHAQKTGEDTGKDLVTAWALGAQFLVEKPLGFLPRNARIADAADYLIAFTWERGAEPQAGGTGNTWRKFMGGRDRAVHVPLHTITGSTA